MEAILLIIKEGDGELEQVLVDHRFHYFGDVTCECGGQGSLWSQRARPFGRQDTQSRVSILIGESTFGE